VGQVTSDDVSITLVSTLADNEAALQVYRSVWGAPSVQDTDIYYVIAKRGGYSAIAWEGDAPIGASFGFLADGGRTLISHMTAVAPGQGNRGIGSALKLHQRSWARDNDIETITWTYDPLVRRNGWFNLVRHGASVSRYTVNYYGALGDDINGDDETDRFEMIWPVSVDVRGGVAVPLDGDYLVTPPGDIETIRRSDPAESRRWRLHLRAELAPRLESGWRVVGMSANHEYVLRRD
jgi:predicted GNAT superfamily acetyltransferase